LQEYGATVNIKSDIVFQQPITIDFGNDATVRCDQDGPGYCATLDGGGADRFFFVFGTLRLIGLRITNGNRVNGRYYYDGGSGYLDDDGGGAFLIGSAKGTCPSAARVHLDRCTVDNNKASVCLSAETISCVYDLWC
jgi:hypothetical protein